MNELALIESSGKPEVLIPEIMPRDGGARAVAVPSPFKTQRLIRHFPIGTSVEEVLRAFGITCDSNARVFVNDLIVLPEAAATTFTKDGDIVTIRVVPGNSKLFMEIALMAVAATATALTGGALAPAMGPVMAGVIGSMAGGAVSLVGSLALSALIPPPAPPGPQFTTNPARFSISGQANIAAPFSVIPKVYGARLIHPMQAATPYTEIVGNFQYLRQLFVLGYGPLDISQIRLQDALIANFESVEWEMRAGYPDDPPPTLYTGAVTEDDINVLLAQSPGNVVTLTGWQQQTSGTAADELSVDISWPAGLMSLGNGNGGHK